MVAVPSPLKIAVDVAESSVGLQNVLKSVGLPQLSHQSALKFVRQRIIPSDEQLILETALLIPWLQECQEVDPEGTYRYKTKQILYNGIECTILEAWIVSFGLAAALVEQTAMLELVAVDGGHIRNLFGGVVLAAVMPTANRRVFPSVFGWAQSEDETSVGWFTEVFYEIFPSTPIVWMNDQGSGLLSSTVTNVRALNGAFSALCAKHLWKTLQVARNNSSNEITGSLKGIEGLLYHFAAARTKDFAENVLKDIQKLNRSVAVYLRDRMDQISAFGALDDGFRRGGRITSQLAESFMNLSRTMRMQGHIGLVQGLHKYITDRWESEKVAFVKYKAANNPLAVKSISPKMSAQYVKEVVPSADKYVVVKWISCTTRHLVGVVAKKDDLTDTRVVEIHWADGLLVTKCDCYLYEEYGWPCARALTLLRTAELMMVEKGHWDWRRGELYALFMRTTTWEEQLELSLADLPAVPELETPELAKKHFGTMFRDGPGASVLPAPISGLQGTPKTRRREMSIIGAKLGV